MTSSGVRKTFHLEKPHLVEAAGEDVDDMTVVRYSLREVVVKLSVLVVELHFRYRELTFKAFL